MKTSGTRKCKSGIKGSYDCITAFSETDFTEYLKNIDIPTLVMHGDDDQIAPFADSGALTAKLVKNATLKVYEGFPHGMPITHADVINKDLLGSFAARRETGCGDGIPPPNPQHPHPSLSETLRFDASPHQVPITPVQEAPCSRE